MVVRYNGPRKELMRLLKVRISLVGCIAQPVLFEGSGLLSRMHADATRPSGAFVNIVTKMNNQIEIFFSHALISVEITILEFLARRESEAQRFWISVCSGSGLGSANLAFDPATCFRHVELIPVPT